VLNELRKEVTIMEQFLRAYALKQITANLDETAMKQIMQLRKMPPQMIKDEFFIDRLKLRIIGGTNILAGDFNLLGKHSSDPYVTVSWGRCGNRVSAQHDELFPAMELGRTAHIKQTLSPRWEDTEEFELPLDQLKIVGKRTDLPVWRKGPRDVEVCALRLDVYDYDIGRKHDPLGSATLDEDTIVRALLQTADPNVGYCELRLDETHAKSVKRRKHGEEEGKLRIMLTLLDEEVLMAPPAPLSSKEGSKRPLETKLGAYDLDVAEAVQQEQRKLERDLAAADQKWKVQYVLDRAKQLEGLQNGIKMDAMRQFLSHRVVPKQLTEHKFKVDRLRLQIIGAANLLAGDFNLMGKHTSDPFVRVSWGRCDIKSGKKDSKTGQKQQEWYPKNDMGRTSKIMTTLSPKYVTHRRNPSHNSFTQSIVLLTRHLTHASTHPSSHSLSCPLTYSFPPPPTHTHPLPRSLARPTSWTDPEEFELPLDALVNGKPIWRDSTKHPEDTDETPFALRITVYDYDLGRTDDVLGSYLFPAEMLMHVMERTAQMGYCEVILDEKHAKTVKKRKNGDSGATLRLKITLLAEDSLLPPPSMQAVAAGSKRNENLVKEKTEEQYSMLQAIQSQHVYLAQQEENVYLQGQGSVEANFVAARSYQQRQRQEGPWNLQIVKDRLVQLRDLTKQLNENDIRQLLETRPGPVNQRLNNPTHGRLMPPTLNAYGFDIDRLKLRVIGGSNLLAGDYSMRGSNTSDPYVKVTWGRRGSKWNDPVLVEASLKSSSSGARRLAERSSDTTWMYLGRTATIKQTLEPEWREPEEFEMPLDKHLKGKHSKAWEKSRDGPYVLKLEVYDYDLGRTNDLLGSVVLDEEYLMQVLTATAQSGFFEVELDEEHARAINARRHTHGKLSLSLSLLDRRHAVFNSPSARAKHTGSKRDPDLVHHPDENDVQAWFGAQSHYEGMPAGNRGGNNSQSLNSSQSYRLASNTHAGDVQPTFDSRREAGKRLSFRKPNTPAGGLGDLRDTFVADALHRQ
jgi:hypothetical protein